MLERLITSVALPPSPQPQLSHGEAMLSLGSCFSDHIGQYLAHFGHQIIVNPFGTLYNPASIIQALERIQGGSLFTEEELFLYQGLYHSPMHHGAFSSTSQATTLKRINTQLAEAHAQQSCLKWLLLTWGTAYIYTERNSRQVVANCHKRPERDFERRLWTPQELCDFVTPTLESLLEKHPDLQIISTISPIRHLRDGAHGNALSKATLLLMNEQLKSHLGDRYHYFPAYEIVLDELRDYRYYAEDLTHPSDLTLKLIRERLSSWLCSPQSLEQAQKLLRLGRQLAHRTLHPDHPDSHLQRQRALEALQSLKDAHPELNLTSILSRE